MHRNSPHFKEDFRNLPFLQSRHDTDSLLHYPTEHMQHFEGSTHSSPTSDTNKNEFWCINRVITNTTHFSFFVKLAYFTDHSRLGLISKGL